MYIIYDEYYFFKGIKSYINLELPSEILSLQLTPMILLYSASVVVVTCGALRIL